jgi:hypothetical protein
MRPRAISHDWLGGKSRPHYRWLIRYVVELLGIGLAYFVCAKAGLCSPRSTRARPRSGRQPGSLWPGIVARLPHFPGHPAAAFLANAATGGSIATSASISVGNMLESLIGAWLISRWSGGPRRSTRRSA